MILVLWLPEFSITVAYEISATPQPSHLCSVHGSMDFIESLTALSLTYFAYRVYTGLVTLTVQEQPLVLLIIKILKIILHL